MDEIDPYEGSPVLIAIPSSLWKEFTEAMDSDPRPITEPKDYGRLAGFICVDAIQRHIRQVRKSVEKKKSAKEKP